MKNKILTFIAQIIYFSIALILSFIVSIFTVFVINYLSNGSSYSALGGIISFILGLMFSFYWLIKEHKAK